MNSERKVAELRKSLETSTTVTYKIEKPDYGPWQFTVSTQETEATIPVFDIRNNDDHKEIGARIADYQSFIAHGAGVYGIAVGLKDPRIKSHPDKTQVFKEAKPDRNDSDKIPLFAPPKYTLPLVNHSLIHPDQRKHFTRDQMEKSWKIGVYHVILPILEPHPSIHPLFITYPEDWQKSNKPKGQHLPVATFSQIWWHDQDFENVSDIAFLENPYGITAISSFNDKGEPPAFQLEDAGTYVSAKKRLPFDFIIRDSEGEQIPLKSSHPQIRPAFTWEEPGWYVHRLGSTSVEAVVRQGIKSDLPIVYLEGATYASRDYPNDFDITPMVFEFMRKIEDSYSRRHPQKGVSLVIQRIGDKITSIVRKAA